MGKKNLENFETVKKNLADTLTIFLFMPINFPKKFVKMIIKNTLKYI